MKWTLFALLMLIAPALLFLVQAFMFLPAVFFAAGILYMIPKAAVSSHSLETLTFIGFFGLHLLVYVGIYLLLSTVCARLLFLIRHSKARNAAFAVLCLGVASLAFFPLYGSGGHGGTKWGTLLDVFQEANRSYGPYTVVIVYGACLLCAAALMMYRRRRHQKIKDE